MKNAVRNALPPFQSPASASSRSKVGCRGRMRPPRGIRVAADIAPIPSVACGPILRRSPPRRLPRGAAQCRRVSRSRWEAPLPPGEGFSPSSRSPPPRERRSARAPSCALPRPRPRGGPDARSGTSTRAGVLRVPPGPEELDGGVDRLVEHVRDRDLRHRHLLAREVALVELPGRVHGEKTPDVNVHRGFAHHPLHPLVLGKGEAEALALLHVLRGDLEGPLGEPEPAHAVGEAGGPEADLGRLEAVPMSMRTSSSPTSSPSNSISQCPPCSSGPMMGTVRTMRQPGWSAWKRNAESPRRASSEVRATTMKCFASRAPVMNHLHPVMTHFPPRRSALVSIAPAGSEPARARARS